MQWVSADVLNKGERLYRYLKLRGILSLQSIPSWTDLESNLLVAVTEMKRKAVVSLGHYCFEKKIMTLSRRKTGSKQPNYWLHAFISISLIYRCLKEYAYNLEQYFYFKKFSIFFCYLEILLFSPCTAANKLHPSQKSLKIMET